MGVTLCPFVCPCVCHLRSVVLQLSNAKAMGPAITLKSQIVTATGGYRATMVRVITNVKRNCRYHDSSRKLARSDITVRNLVRSIQDAGVIVPAKVIGDIFAALDVSASGRVSCAKVLRLLKMAPLNAAAKKAASAPPKVAVNINADGGAEGESKRGASSHGIVAAPKPAPTVVPLARARQTSDIFGVRSSTPQRCVLACVRWYPLVHL